MVHFVVQWMFCLMLVLDDFTKQCEVAQLEDRVERFGSKEGELRRGVWNKLEIQLEFWRQRAKGK